MLLAEEIERLASEAANAGDYAVASILYTVNAAILEGTEAELRDLTVEFSRQRLADLDGDNEQ